MLEPHSFTTILKEMLESVHDLTKPLFQMGNSIQNIFYIIYGQVLQFQVQLAVGQYNYFIIILEHKPQELVINRIVENQNQLLQFRIHLQMGWDEICDNCKYFCEKQFDVAVMIFIVKYLHFLYLVYQAHIQVSPTQSQIHHLQKFTEDLSNNVNLYSVTSYLGKQLSEVWQDSCKQLINQIIIAYFHPFIIHHAFHEPTQVSQKFMLTISLLKHFKEKTLQVDCFFQTIIKMATYRKGLYSFKYSRQVVQDKQDTLTLQNIQKFVDPEFVLIQDIVESQSHKYLCDTLPHCNSQLCPAKKISDGSLKKFKYLRFDIGLALGIPLKTKYDFLNDAKSLEHLLLIPHPQVLPYKSQQQLLRFIVLLFFELLE